MDGIAPNWSWVVAPWVEIFTTAGPTRSAAPITADDSSMVTGCWPAMGCATLGFEAGAGWSNAPARSRATTVPPEASTAARSAAATTVPAPAPPRLRGCGAGWTVSVPYAGGGGVPEPVAGWPQAGVVPYGAWARSRVGLVPAVGRRLAGGCRPGPAGVGPGIRCRGIAGDVDGLGVVELVRAGVLGGVRGLVVVHGRGSFSLVRGW